MADFVWDDKCYFNAKTGNVVHGKCTSLKGMSEEDQKKLQEDLKRHGVKFKIREATQPTEHIKAGDTYLAITDAESVFNLYANIFNYALMGDDLARSKNGDFSMLGYHLIEESLEDYNNRLNTNKEEENALKEQEAAFMKNPAEYIASSANNIAKILMDNPEMKKKIFDLLGKMETKEEPRPNRSMSLPVRRDNSR